MATQLIETLTGRGRRVAVIAASQGPLAIDAPGKDSYEHAAAGARDVVVVSAGAGPACTATTRRRRLRRPPSQRSRAMRRWYWHSGSTRVPPPGSRSNAVPDTRPAEACVCWRRMAASRR